MLLVGVLITNGCRRRLGVVAETSVQTCFFEEGRRRALTTNEAFVEYGRGREDGAKQLLGEMAQLKAQMEELVGEQQLLETSLQVMLRNGARLIQ